MILKLKVMICKSGDKKYFVKICYHIEKKEYFCFKHIQTT